MTSSSYHYHLATRTCERFASTDNKQNSLVDLASAIIDPYYMKMKDESKKYQNAGNGASDQRLDGQHIKYAVNDMYTSYEMYTQIIDMRKCLRPTPDEGLCHRAIVGASQEVDDRFS
ncbi:putative ubiquitin-conjugating enzyme E2 26 [Hordeum vulgare]|nr:putative ubiquitin-conjugating enzyme E2 26 [Hordeum vulgare]